MGKTVYLSTPLDVEQIRLLNWTMWLILVAPSTSCFERLMEPIRREEPFTLKLDGGVIYHTGTICHSDKPGPMTS